MASRRNLKAVRVKTGLEIGMLAVFSAAGCAWFSSEVNKPCPDPQSCECPTTTNPACPPWPNDNGDNPSTMTKRPDGGTSR
jgi:hypothetical protein